MKKGPQSTLVSLAESPEALLARLEDMERRADRLRALYESYFLGVERTAPYTPRRELNRLLLETQQVVINNATLRFRFQSIQQKWVLYTAYWNRTMREIEGGTYRRDLAKAQRHLAKRGGSLTEADALALGIPSNRVKAFIERQTKAYPRQAEAASAKAAVSTEPPAGQSAVLPPTGGEPSSEGSSVQAEQAPLPSSPAAPGSAVSAAPPPLPVQATSHEGRQASLTEPHRSGVPAGLGDGDIEAFYARYLKAHATAQDPRPAISLADMRARLLAQAPKLLSDERLTRVDLEVHVDDGRVRVRARPVRG